MRWQDDAFERDLVFAVQCVREGWRISMHAFDTANKPIPLRSTASENAGKLGAYPFDADMVKSLGKACTSFNCPYVWREAELVYFISIKMQESLFVLGPIASQYLSSEQTKAYMKTHHIAQDDYTMPSLTASRAIHCTCVVCYLLTREQYDMNTFLILNPQISEIYYAKAIEYTMNMPDRNRYSYEVEQAWMERISLGIDITDMHHTKESPSPDNVGHLARSPGKQLEYALVSALALMPRAAIKGGLTPEESYALSDVFYQQMEQCKTDQEMYHVYIRAMGAFTGQVRLRKQMTNENDYVALCKDYIEKALFAKISVTNIADALFISPNYLSHLFAQKTGMTISQYIHERRLDRGAELLRHTTMEISEVAAKLTFQSQSHFGRLFKERFTMTPGEVPRKVWHSRHEGETQAAAR